MKSSMAWTGQWWKTAWPVLAAIVVLAGCIPSEPEAKPAPAPDPAAAQTAPIITPPATTQPAQTPSSAPPQEGKRGPSLNISPLAEPNASVAVEPMKDGAGFSVRGTFNLQGTIVPNGPGKWKFAGQFSAAEADFAVGVPTTMPMSKLDPVNTGNATAEDNLMIMIDIPVRPPAARAPEGTAQRSIPISLDIDAPGTAEFTVSLTQM